MRKTMISKVLIVLLTVILLFSVMLLFSYAATSVSISVTNLSAEYTNGTVQEHDGSANWSGGGNSINGSAKGQDAGSSGSGLCSTSWSAGASDTTLTFTSTSTYPATLAFDYTLTLNGGSVTIDGSSKTTNGQFSKTLTNGGTVSVKITSPKSSSTTSISITNITLTVNPVSVTANTSNSTMGTASASPVIVTPPGSSIFTANPKPGHKFVRWTDSGGTGVSTDNPYTLNNITTATTLTAVFEAIEQTTVSFAPAVSVSGDADGGSYTVSGGKISGTQTMAYDASSFSVTDYVTETYTLTASPKSGYRFDGWYDAAGGKLNGLTTWTPTLEEIKGKTVHAQFSSETVSVVFGPVSTTFPNGSYTVVYDGSTQTMTTDSADYRVTGRYDTTATLTATPETDYEFAGWMNAAYQTVHNANPLTQPLEFFEETGAIFPAFQYTKARVTFHSTDKGTVTVSVAGATQPLDEEIGADKNATVVLSLSNISGDYSFDGWIDGEGNILSTSTNWTTDMTALTGYTETTETLNGVSVTQRSQTNYNISPSFTWKKASLTLIPGANGTLKAGLENTTLSTVSAQTVTTELKSAQYTLQAVESDGNYVFVGWYDGNGDCVNDTDNPWTATFETLSTYGSLTPRFQSAMVTMSVEASSNGTTKIGDETISGTVTRQFDSRTSYTFSATPASGYVFGGWLDQDGNCLSVEASWTAKPKDNTTIHARFIAESGLATFQVGSTTYTDLNAANTAANNGSNKTIIVISDGSVPAGNYTISSGVTLLIPFNDSNTVITNANISSNYEEYQQNTPSEVYRTLTLENGVNISVDGSISVASKVYCMSSGQSGPYGLIQMDSGSSITLKSGAKLHAFGYIRGSGTIEAESGSFVYESLAVADYPGSSINCNNLKNAKAFPFSKFTIRNVEVRMTLESGATENVYFNLYGTSVQYHDAWVSLIGGPSSNALFKTEGSVVKSYSNNRQYIEIRGTSSINPMGLKISIINASTSEMSGLPIPYNYTIEIKSGTTTMNENVILSKGSVVTIDSGASAIVSSGKKLYVLDSSDDVQSVGSGLADAKLDINGILEVHGGLLTSENGANITSGQKSGVIVFKSAAVSPTEISLKVSGGNSKKITTYQARLLNGDSTYESTSLVTANTNYYYCKTHNKWETTHLLTYHSNLTVDSTETQSFSGTEAQVKDIAAVNAGWEKTGYHFAGWNTMANGSGDAVEAGASYTFNRDSVPTDLYAQWAPNEYTLTLNPTGGSVDPTTATVTYDSTYGAAFTDGALPTPTRTGAGAVYRFDGWFTAATGGSAVAASDTVTITQDTTLFAHWSTMYTVTFDSNGGSEVAAQQVAYNSYAEQPTAPTKSGATFAGWYADADLTTAFDFSNTRITESITLYAKWTYTVTFNVQGHGTAPEDQAVESGKKATEPSPAPTADGYTFVGWYKEAACTNAWDFSTDTVTANTILYAKWTQAFTVSFVTKGGSEIEVIDQQLVEPNGKSTQPADPTRTGATFGGWYSDEDLTTAFDFDTAITRDTTIYAKWTYTLVFKYQTTMNGSDTQGTSGTIKYTYGKSVAEPSIRYYRLDHWTLNGDDTNPYTNETIGAAVMSAIDTAIQNGTDPSTITVKAFFVRKTYTILVYSQVFGEADSTRKLELTLPNCNAGRTMWLNADKTITRGEGESETVYNFKQWVIDGVTDTNIKTSYFSADPSETVIAVAYYAVDATHTTLTSPSVTVKDFFTEQTGDSYVAGMTLEVIAPTDTTGFSVKQVGFGYTVDPTRVTSGEFSEKSPNPSWAERTPAWTSGTYLVRFKMPTSDTTLYTYGYAVYTKNDGTDDLYKAFAVYGGTAAKEVKVTVPNTLQVHTTVYNIITSTTTTTPGMGTREE